MPKQPDKIRNNVASLFAGLGEVQAPAGLPVVSESTAAPEGEPVVMLPLAEIQLDPVQVRYYTGIDELHKRAESGSRWAVEQLQELRALGEHMREHGQIQPIRVFRAAVGRPYQVLVGHRRVLAAELVGLPGVAAVVAPEEPDELQKLDFQVGENVHRRNFNDMERARIFERFKGAIARRGRPSRREQPQREQLDDAAIAARLGVKPERMAQIFRLTRFARAAQDLIIEEGWPETVLRPLHQALATLKLDEQGQLAVLQALAHRATLKDGLLTNSMVAEYVRELQQAQAAQPGRSWVQSQLRQLNDASRDLVRLREQFAGGREMPDDARDVLRAALQNLEHELLQTRKQVFGDENS
jgi:ParB/RepB/Spo0J family partition protein